MAQDDLARLGIQVDSAGVATARGRLQAFKRAGGRAERATDRLTRSTTRLNSVMGRLRGTVGRLGALFAAGFGIVALTRTLANFAQEMSTVSAITQASATEFISLREEAKRLGATTRFSASQAAAGMTFLARAGFTVSQVLASVNDTLLLAQAGALDLATAADIASNILKGFRLEAEETARVVDVLALTANSSNTNIVQLGAAMSFLAPAAAAVGIEVEEAAAAVGVLSDAGIQATRAGTGMRQIFIQLLNPTGKARAELERLGLAVKDINVETRGLVPVLKTLRDAQIGLSQSANLVGARQSASLLVLVQSIERLEQLTAANKEAEGTARRVADVMDDNLNGALLATKSAIEALVIAFGDLGTESALTGAFNALADALRAVAAVLPEILLGAKAAGAALAIAFSVKIALSIWATVRAAVALQLALGATSLSAAAFGAAVVGATRAVRAFTLALARNPLGLIAIGIAAVVTSLTIYNRKMSDAAVATREYREALNGANKSLEAANKLTGEAAVGLQRESIERFGATRAILAENLALKQLIITRQEETLNQLFPELGGNTRTQDLSTVKGLSGADERIAAGFINTLERLRNEADLTVMEMTELDSAIIILKKEFKEANLVAAVLAEIMEEEAAAADKATTASDKLKDSFNALISSLEPAAQAQRDYITGLDLILQAENAGLIDRERSIELFGKLREATNAARFPIIAMELALEEERRQVQMTNDEREIHVRLLKLENDARAQGRILTDAQREAFERELTAIQNLRKARILDETATKDRIQREIEKSRTAAQQSEQQVKQVGDAFKQSFGEALKDIRNVTGALSALNDKLFDLAANKIFDDLFGDFFGGGNGRSGGFNFGKIFSFLGFGGGANVGFDTSQLLVGHGGGLVDQLPRYHQGRSPLKQNEQFAVLKDSEEVLTEDNDRHIKNAGKRRRRDGGNTFIFQMPAGTDPDQMKRSAGQFASRINRAIRTGSQRVD